MFKPLLTCALIMSSTILGGCVYGDGETEEDSGTVVSAESIAIETEAADELTVDADKITCGTAYAKAAPVSAKNASLNKRVTC